MDSVHVRHPAATVVGRLRDHDTGRERLQDGMEDSLPAVYHLGTGERAHPRPVQQDGEQAEPLYCDPGPTLYAKIVWQNI